jgi:hypothetical protein
MGYPLPASAQAAAQSSRDDMQRVIAITHKLERNPLDTSLWDERSWAVRWLVDAPDVTVHACLKLLGGKGMTTYKYADVIIAQYMLGLGTFVIVNPTKANDIDAQELAGVESALNAYRSIRIANPHKMSSALESLLMIQKRGELPDFVHKSYLQCLAESGK